MGPRRVDGPREQTSKGRAMTQLAELNIAVPLRPLTDPLLQDFTDNLDRINRLAERAPGFVWRHMADARDGPDPALAHLGEVIPNLSVWDSVEALERFAFGTVHRQFYARRKEWMQPLASRHFVMWWVEDGHQPTMAEAIARLDHLNAHGDSDSGFGWSHMRDRLQFQNAVCTRENA